MDIVEFKFKRKAIRIYADTSVFGGVFDDEFKNASTRFFDLVKAGIFQLVISPLVEDEIEKAPDHVKALYNEVEKYSEFVEFSPEAYALQEAYLKADILTRKWEEDALHVALASVSDCAIIISWNFKHIVNYRKIPFYVAVNTALGYKPITILSPMEVIEDDKEKI